MIGIGITKINTMPITLIIGMINWSAMPNLGFKNSGVQHGLIS